jgi:protein-S-isoprenylcysteine O-methyltransferase Ste14
MSMNLLRIFLLSGLIAHKLVWEVLKRPRSRTGNAGVRPTSLPSAMLIKTVKIGILLFIIAQTMLPDILPLGPDSNSVRMAGAVLYAIGLGVAIISRVQLGGNWSDIESARVLNTQAVVSDGIYSYVRHPIYLGDLLLLFGLELSLNSWLIVGVALLAPIVLWKAVREEKLLAGKLPGYDEYCLRTKRFIPYLI